MMKRTLAFLLVISMLLTMLAACSGDSEKTDGKNPTTSDTADTADVTAPSVSITAEVEPIDESLANLDYGGDRVITILSRDSKKDTWAKDEIYIEELTNDSVKDSVYNRNASVCDILGLKEIVSVVSDGQEGIQQKVNLMVGSGDQTYDIVAASVAYGTPMINQGLMYNLYDNGIDTYLGAEKPWWSQYWIEQAEMGDRLYCITGAPALSLSRLMFVMYYNKDLGERLGVEDMYAVVDEGRWTIDYLNELIPEMYNDNNGDSLKDEEDRYGIAINHYEHCDMFWSAFDMTMISKDEDGWFEFDTLGKEKISNAFDKVFYLIRENPGTYDTIDTGGFDVAMGMFAGGNVLFAPLHLKYAETASFRNMQDEYGILPIPKYDERQDNYYTYAHDQYTVFMVPKTVENPEMSGAVLETMAYESYRTVQPTYYNIVLKGRYANDPQSRKMLDTITQNVKVDPAWIYGRQLGQPAAYAFRIPIYDGVKSFATAYAKQERMLPIYLKEMKKVVSEFDF